MHDVETLVVTGSSQLGSRLGGVLFDVPRTAARGVWRCAHTGAERSLLGVARPVARRRLGRRPRGARSAPRPRLTLPN